MPSAPLMACSSGVVTAVSTSTALAPVYTAVTEMLGGASGGNCATGIVGMATRPKRMMTSEQTDAMIGRLMNVFTNIRCARLLSLHRYAVGDLLDARHNELIAGLQSAFHDVVVALDLADFHRALMRDQALAGRL